jgi:hypothetical protein
LVLFNKEDEDAAKAERIKQSLSVLGLPAINVSYTEGQVTLSGKASTPEQKEKAILMTGNVEGVEKVNADALEAPAQTVQVDYYTIQSGRYALEDRAALLRQRLGLPEDL